MSTTTTEPATPAAPVTSAAPVTPTPHDGGKPPYSDPTGDTAARNVDGERRDAERDGKAGKEAAKYRAQLRDVEAERDGLRTQLEAFQRQSVESIAESAGLKGAAIWAAGTVLSGMLREDGTIDHDAVSVAIGATREALGIPLAASASDAGLTQGSQPTRTEPTWAGITRG